MRLKKTPVFCLCCFQGEHKDAILGVCTENLYIVLGGDLTPQHIVFS